LGSAGAQINTADEVLVTELILEGVFNSLEPEELVALLSAFVFEERTNSDPVLTERLQAVRPGDAARRGRRMLTLASVQGKDAFLAVAAKVAAAQVACRVPVTEEDYLGRLRFGLTEVVYEWARGMVRARGARGPDARPDLPEGGVAGWGWVGCGCGGA
jgi:antiviral helicase SKI2